MELLNWTAPAFQPSILESEPVWLLPVIYNYIYFFPLIAVSGLLALGFSPAQGNALIDAPIIGPKSAIFSRYYFFKDAWLYVEEGYAKVTRPNT